MNTEKRLLTILKQLKRLAETDQVPTRPNGICFYVMNHNLYRSSLVGCLQDLFRDYPDRDKSDEWTSYPIAGMYEFNKTVNLWTGESLKLRLAFLEWAIEELENA